MNFTPKMAEIIRFGIVGTISTLTLYGAYWLCLFLFSPSIAYTIAYVCAFVINYLLTTSFTFRVKKSFKNGLGFIGSNVINYFVSIMLLNVFLLVGVNDKFAPIPTLLLATISNYFIVKFVMKQKC